MEEEIKIWENYYQKGHYDVWPTEIVVTLIYKFYGSKERKKTTILDLGCGSGNNTYFLSKSGFLTYAVDGSPTSIKETKKRLKQENLSANCQIANIKKLPYENDFFDCVLDRASVFCNKWEDIFKIYDEIYRTLKRGGRYIGFLPNYSLSKLAHIFNEDDIYKALKKFKIENILWHSVKSLTHAKEELIKIGEFIVIAKKS